MEDDAARGRKVYKATERQRDAIEAASAKRRASRTKTAREEANWVAADELRAAVRDREEELGSLLSGDAPGVTAPRAGNSALEAFLVLALAERYPSRLDLATVLLATPGKGTEPETSVLELGTPLRFRIHQSPEAGERVITPDARMQRLLQHVLKVCQKQPGDFLFESARGGPLSRPAMGRRITRFFEKRFPGKKIGTAMLSKILRERPPRRGAGGERGGVATTYSMPYSGTALLAAPLISTVMCTTSWSSATRCPKSSP